MVSVVLIEKRERKTVSWEVINKFDMPFCCKVTKKCFVDEFYLTNTPFASIIEA